LAFEFQLLSCSRIVDRFPVAALKNYHQLWFWKMAAPGS